jgi:phosphoglycolate phosphatase-like HAD superfamily hydrolase
MPLDTSRIRLICFDIDGTLRDTDDQYVARLSRWLHPFRFLLTRQDAHLAARRLVMASEDPGRLLIGLPDWLGIDGFLARIGNLFYHLGPGKRPANFLIIPGVKEMLDQLQPHFLMAVVTARGEHGTRAFLDHYSLNLYFPRVAYAQTCRHTKPYPDPILWVASELGIPATQCLMVGDTIVDIQAGKSAGAQTVGVLCGFGEKEELVRTSADLIIPSTKDLVNYLL